VAARRDDPGGGVGGTVAEHQLDKSRAEILHVGVKPEVVGFGTEGVEQDFVPQTGDAARQAIWRV
jgi:hypothetical protein